MRLIYIAALLGALQVSASPPEQVEFARMDQCGEAEATMVHWMHSIGLQADIDSVLEACSMPMSDEFSDECTLLVEDCGY